MTKVLLRIYNNLLHKHFLLVQTVQTGMIMGLGDLIAQTAAEKKSLKEIDRVRTRSFFIIGVGLVGPCSAAWYKILSRTFGDTGKAAVLKKVAVDQLLYAPFFMLVFIAAINTLEGKSWDEVKREIDDKYFDLALYNLKIWPAIQIVNFYLVPFNYQIPFVQTIGVFWNAFVSWKLNRPDKEK